MTAYEHRLGIFRLHADPKFGSPYWISFFARSGISPEDAAAAPLLLPVTDIETLRTHPVEHFISQKVLSEGQWLISGETSGFSGKPILTMFTEKEFHDSFVTPFILRAEEMGFPVKSRWLWAGPTGPHIVGKAIREILKSVGGQDPLSVDFDPRWYRKMPDGSIGKKRYFRHVIEQVLALFETQRVDVLFSTPPVIHALLAELSEADRAKIVGVHYAGVASTAEEYALMREAFRNAVHMNGYGNSLFAVFPELSFQEHGIEYSNLSENRISLEVVKIRAGEPAMEPVAVGETGRVLLSRYDESMLIVNMLERDVAIRTTGGICDPHPERKHPNGKVLY